MAINYTPLTDFLTKDTLPKEDPDKVILGADFDAEFNAISTAFAGAAPTNNPTFTGTATFDGVTVNTVTINGLATLGSLDISGNATVGGTLDVTGNATFGGDLDVTGTVTSGGAQLPTLEDVQDIVSGAELGPISELGNLSNVDETGKADGDYLAWDQTSGNWEPSTLDLSALTTDVRTTAAIKAGSYEETNVTGSGVTVTTPYTISNATLVGNQSLSYSTAYNSQLWVSPDGTKFVHMHGEQNGNAGSGTLHTAYQPVSGGVASDVTWSGSQINAKAGISGSTLRNLWVSQDGTKVAWFQHFAADTATWNRPIIFETSVPWVLADANMTLLSKGGLQTVTSPGALWFSEDGTRVWTGNQSAPSVTEWSLSTPWDWSTALYVTDATPGGYANGNGDQGTYGLYFSADGYTLLRTAGDSVDSQAIYKIELSTAWDITTGTTTGKFPYSAISTASLANAPHFYEDGAQMMLTGGTSGWDTYTITQDITTATLDCATANTFDLTLDTSMDLAFSNVPASGTSYACSVTVKQDATGNHAITWPSSVVWAGGEAPTLTADASAEDVFVFMTSDGGTIWYGFTSGQAFA